MQLRRVVEDLDPGKRGNLTAPKKLFGILPFGNKMRDYFDSYKSSQTHIASILKSLQSGKDELLMDNAAIDTERANLWAAMGRLEQMIHLSKTMDAKLEEMPSDLSQGQRKLVGVARALALNPNLAMAWALSGFAHPAFLVGRFNRTPCSSPRSTASLRSPTSARKAFASASVKKRNSPGARSPSDNDPIRIRINLMTGCPTVSSMRLTWCFRPSRMVISSQELASTFRTFFT